MAYFLRRLFRRVRFFWKFSRYAYLPYRACRLPPDSEGDCKFGPMLWRPPLKLLPLLRKLGMGH
jgi:hypothetical protein